MAECLALDAVETNDLNTVVTEACNNVVMHAYGGGEGALEVDVFARAGAIAVVVRDHGSGMPPRERDGDQGESGMGLAVIEALSRRVELAQPPGGGTEVRMELAASKAAPLESSEGDGEQRATPTHVALQSSVELRLAPDAIARSVLPRVLSSLAARAQFCTDRIADVQLIADVLAANAGDSIDASHLDVGVTVAPRSLELRIGPLHAGRGESLLAAAADGHAPVIERLTGASRVARADAADDARETLELSLVDERR